MAVNGLEDPQAPVSQQKKERDTTGELKMSQSQTEYSKSFKIRRIRNRSKQAKLLLFAAIAAGILLEGGSDGGKVSLHALGVRELNVVGGNF